jgi:hypothetical protein
MKHEGKTLVVLRTTAFRLKGTYSRKARRSLTIGQASSHSTLIVDSRRHKPLKIDNENMKILLTCPKWIFRVPNNTL